MKTVVGLLALMFLLSSCIASGATVDGQWVLDRLEVDRYLDKPSYTEYPANPVTHTTSIPDSREGYCSGLVKYDYAKEPARNSSLPFWIRWVPGPKTARPGTVWNIGFSTDGGPAKRVSYFQRRVGSDIDISVDDRFLARDHSYRNDFAFPEPVPGVADVLIAVVAVGVVVDEPDLWNGGRGQVDLYVYRYRWMQSKQVSGRLKIHAASDYGPIQGVVFRVRNSITGAESSLVTDVLGNAEGDFGAEDARESLEVEVREAVLGSGVKMSQATAPVLFSTKIPPIPIRQVVLLPDRKSVAIHWVLPAFKLSLFSYCWDESLRQWTGCPATVVVGGPKVSYMKIPPAHFKNDSGRVVAEVLVPSLQALQTPWLQARGFESITKATGLVRLGITPGASSVPIVATLNISDPWTKLRRSRMLVREFFSGPEFRGVADVEQVNLIATLNIVVDPQAPVPVATTDGVMTVQSENHLDIDESDNADTLMHEWTHHIFELFAPDPEVEGQLGYPHRGGFFQLNGSPEMAWDEGRAHFSGSLLNIAMKVPNNADQLNFDNSARWMRENPTAAPGNRNEGIVASALLDYYRQAGFRSTRQVYVDFIRVHSFSRERHGRPPRTMNEFLDALKEYNDVVHPQNSGSMNRAVEAVRSAYKVN